MVSSLVSRKRRHEQSHKDGATHDIASPRADADTNSSSRPSLNTPYKKSRQSTSTSPSVDLDPVDVSLSQHQAALTLSQLFLRSARSAAERSLRRLKQTKDEYSQRQAELRQAESWSEAVQRRWGVICIDLDGSHDDTAPNGRSDEQAVVVPSAVANDSERTRGDKLATSADHLEAIPNENRPIKQIEISCAGDQFVNGIYQECIFYHHDNYSHQSLSTVNNIRTGHVPQASPDSIYIHTSGPFLLPHNHRSHIYYDLCLYKKWGYGDKMRWCIGLVPSTFNHCQHEDEVAVTWETPRQWNFHQSYIYYWMEVPLLSTRSENSTRSTMDDHATHFLLDEKQRWSACHGMRPVPSLREVQQHVWWRRWRSFWE
ncbi:hypothetical protein ACHAW6_007534 [Cyclotella cf. meneghiniana]